MMDHRGVWHGGTRRIDRCAQHRLTDEHYVPQLRRLLTGAARERRVYDSFVEDVVRSDNPLDLFERSRQRPGMYFIEALYRTHSERAEYDAEAVMSLAPLGYSRWVAWRRFGDAVRNRSVTFDRGVDDFIARSRRDVVSHLFRGWQPAELPSDPEFIELLGSD